MAGVAENIQVVSSEKSQSVVFAEDNDTDMTFNHSGADDTSLQELIDSELALRIGSMHSQVEESSQPVEEQAVEVEAIPVSLLQPLDYSLEADPSEQFIEIERLHTTATLNVFSDTIDLSPDCEPTSPIFPRSPTDPDISSQIEQNPFEPSDISPDVSPEVSTEVSPNFDKPLVNLDDDSPVTEDASDLEPMPLFTQTITSDNEQSPLTEVNPFIVDEVLIEPVSDDILPDKETPSGPPIEDVLVVIEPPDDNTPVTDSPELISPEDDILIDFTETETNLIEVTQVEEPLVVEQVVEIEPKLSVEEPIVEPKLLIEEPIVEPELVVEQPEPEPSKDSPSVESDTKACVDSVDASVSIVSNSMREFCVANPPAAEEDSEWTTVEDATKEVQSCEATQVFETQPLPQRVEEIPPSTLPLHNNVSEMVTSTTTKTVKKKKSTEGGDATSTRTKKTKKTKKSEEKENHISVMTNGHSPSPPSSPVDSATSLTSPTSPTGPLDDDELSNVCVRDLKQTYCREAAKSLSASLKVPSEEPVPPPVSIRELRRSFCDLQKACEAAEPPPPSSVSSSQLKARSLGDLRRLSDSPPQKNIHTGVSVKALAASYWNLVSHEPPLSPHALTPPPNKLVAQALKKSSFSKFDQLQKKTVLHVRSSDVSKTQKQFNQETPEAQGANPTCKSCNKTVFAMEQVKAERSVWHKNCFRCKECSKQLTVDIYQSHEGELFCKPHFKELFKPKAVVDNTEDEPLRRRKPEMIIRENQPMELPPDVFRASDKADLGLEELSALNVKSRFQVFEKTSGDSEVERSPSTVNVKRSPSILSKLAKFQKKGMDVGVTDESLNGVDYEESSSSEDEAQGEEGQVVKGSKKPERPVSFNKMEDVKRTWETTSGATKTREELRAEHKKEISQIRSRLFQGKQGKMKEMYEQAVADSEGKGSCKKDQDIVASEKARLLKERFERGEIVHSDSEEDEEKKKNKETEDMSVFEAGISKKSRSIFLELDATAAKTQTSPLTPPVHALTPRATERRSSQTVSRQVSEDVVRCSDPTDDIVVPTADVSNKFKFFETYKAPEKERKAFRITPPRDGQVKEGSPDREVYRDPAVVRSEDTAEDETIVKRSQTASRMLSLFRQMEEQKEEVPDGPKPLKCFTPPPDYKEDQSEGSEDEDEESEEEEESEDDTGIVKASDKIEDEFLKQAQNAARAKALKEKFEHWEPEKQSVNNAINLLDSEQESIESTKSLRARFESLKAEQPKEKPRPKVNRFVLQEVPALTNKCRSCDKTVYPLEKVEVDGKLYHANCFRCQQCQCKLRMESYTLNNDNLYCLPHFRQLFIAKGNYDEGFGSNQHKRKWEAPAAAVNGTH